ncbi:MAG: transposase [Phycisphaerales bacterium]|nr:transposase [Phycisphaerales bacterium]
MLLLATANPHKVEEMQAIFAALLPDLRLLSLADLPGGPPPEPAETGTTFEANATIKARAYAAASGMPCLADDSGLEIDALNGRPGVISSHYCTDGQETGMTRAQRDQANNQRVLRELEGVAPEKRTARFVCTMALSLPHPPKHPPKHQWDRPPAGRQLPTPSERLSLLTPLDLSPVQSHPPGPLIIRNGSLPHWERGGSTYFITFRVLQGKLAPQERDIVLDACLHWHNQRAIVHLVIVMPDHVHLILTPLPNGETWHTLADLMQSIKTFTSRTINAARGVTGTLWQPEYFDRLIRHADELREKWQYTLENPVRKGLVRNWLEYQWTSGGALREDRPEAGPTALARGTFEGRIGLPTQVPRGSHGFGYDPLFLVAPDFTHTGAELDPSEKNRLSHRAAAAGQMAQHLRALLAADPHALGPDQA